MRYFIYTFLILNVVTLSAFADNNSATSNATSVAGAGSTLILDQSAHNSGNVAGTDMSNMVPNVVAPGLATTLTETYS